MEQENPRPAKAGVGVLVSPASGKVNSEQFETFFFKTNWTTYMLLTPCGFLVSSGHKFSFRHFGAMPLSFISLDPTVYPFFRKGQKITLWCIAFDGISLFCSESAAVAIWATVNVFSRHIYMKKAKGFFCICCKLLLQVISSNNYHMVQRYDGIYKCVRYWPQKGSSGFIV